VKIPVIDWSRCSECDACIDLCQEVFRKNDLGVIEVADLSEYPQEAVDEVIKNCPGDCISWEEI
jgi:ferredoxin